MSVQFGRWNFDGRPLQPTSIHQASSSLAAFGPDTSGAYADEGFTVLYRGFFTSTREAKDKLPHLLSTGEVLVWEGRLDNGKQLAEALSGRVSAQESDLAIVSEAYARWGTGCLPMLLGDWAVSIWEPRSRSLVLAKDFLGTRPLYYSLTPDYVAWGSLLAPLLRTAKQPFRLDEEYVAGWLSAFPATTVTPYREIRSVPPASFVRIRNGRATTTTYWKFDPAKHAILKCDQEYEESFRTLLSESIRRRLRSDYPVVAELSGGVDSSSIVCLADHLLRAGKAEAPRLDTISYFDDAEPNWNERPYFTKVEELRGRTGVHIDMHDDSKIPSPYGSDRFFPVPGARSGRSSSAVRFASSLSERGNRVLLSGIGGDEVTGGIPAPVPYLTELLARAKFRSFAAECTAWALAERRPLLHWAADIAKAFLPGSLLRTREQSEFLSWLNPNFRRRQHRTLDGYHRPLGLFGPRASFHDNLETLEALRRQFACTGLSSNPLYERRYPYLDRDLLEFLYAIPANQLLRPGQRRSLMRRALAGIVPDEILNRRRKAFVVRSPMAALANDYSRFRDIEWVAASLGFLDQRAFSGALRAAREGRDVHVIALLRILELEYWLEHLLSSGLLKPQHLGSSFREPRLREFQISFPTEAP